jgi:hypothetical protein
MQDFVNHEFKNHPAIAGEYIKFMVENSNNDASTTFDTKSDELDKAMKEIKKNADLALKASSSASSKADQAAEDAKRGDKAAYDLKKFDLRVKNLNDSNGVATAFRPTTTYC